MTELLRQSWWKEQNKSRGEEKTLALDGTNIEKNLVIVKLESLFSGSHEAKVINGLNTEINNQGEDRKGAAGVCK